MTDRSLPDAWQIDVNPTKDGGLHLSIIACHGDPDAPDRKDHWFDCRLSVEMAEHLMIELGEHLEDAEGDEAAEA